MTESFDNALIHEYFYKRLTEIDETERELIYVMRTKVGLIILLDKLRALEIEKQVMLRVYEDMRLFF